MARLSLFGVYPAREDIMVGDVLLYAPPDNRRGPDEGELARFLTTRLAGAPCDLLMRELAAQGQQRPRLQPVPAAGKEVQAMAPAPAMPGTARAALGAAGGGCGPAGRGTTAGDFEIGSSDSLTTNPAVRLQRTVVPRLTVARLTEGQIAGQALLGNVGAALGLGGSGSIALTVSLKDTEALRLDAPRITDLVTQVLVQDVRAGRRDTRGEDRALRLHPADVLRALEQRSSPGRQLGRMACRGDFDGLADSGARIIVVNDVMFARQIEFGFNRSSDFAARLALDLQNALALGRTVIPAFPSASGAGGAAAAAGAAPSTPGTSQPTPAANPPASPAQIAALAASRARLDDLRQSILGGPTNSNAGLAASMGISTSGELALSITTARPLAVGFGSALDYPIEQALIPTRPRDIDEAMLVCAAVIGTPMSLKTHNWLRWNFDWIVALADGNEARLRELTAAADATLFGARPRLRPIFAHSAR